MAECWGLIASIRTDRLLWCPVKTAAHQATNTLGYATDARAQCRGLRVPTATSVTDDVNPCVSAATDRTRTGGSKTGRCLDPIESRGWWGPGGSCAGTARVSVNEPATAKLCFGHGDGVDGPCCPNTGLLGGGGTAEGVTVLVNLVSQYRGPVRLLNPQSQQSLGYLK